MPELDAGSTIRLTQTVAQGGCAAKLPAGQLRGILSRLESRRPRELLVGNETLDDACLWDLGDGRLLVQTLDFFTPIVDDPGDFGAIAAANAISDVYAMGGLPATALAILAFPARTLPLELAGPLLRGAVEKLNEAGACLAGGHTIEDETLKLGFSVTGFVARDKAWTNAGCRPGDALILTKGLGTGTITTALKIREARAEWVQAAISSMKTLNRAVDLLEGITVRAATDITGFGLAGHALQMAQASQVTFEIACSSLPALEGALQSLRDGNLNRAHHTNRDYAQGKVRYVEDLDPALRWLTLDPQTSGGLLLSVPASEASRAVTRLRARFPLTAEIGRALGRERGSSEEVRFTMEADQGA